MHHQLAILEAQNEYKTTELTKTGIILQIIAADMINYCHVLVCTNKLDCHYNHIMIIKVSCFKKACQEIADRCSKCAVCDYRERFSCPRS